MNINTTYIIKILSYLLILFTWNSCSSKEEATNDYYGSWVSIEYLEDLKETKSIYQTNKNLNYKILHIEKKNCTKDSISISWKERCQSEHSGFNMYSLLNDSTLEYIGYYFGRKSDINKKDAGSHNLEYSKKDNSIKMYMKGTFQEKYIHLSDSSNIQDVDFAFRKKINEILISGKYRIKNQEINFTDEGEVSNLNNYVKFEFVLNSCFDNSLYGKFTVLEFFNPNTKMSNSADENLNNKFAVEITDKTVLLYEVIEAISNNSYELIKGDLKYKLIQNAP